MELKDMMTRLEDLEEEYDVYKMEMLNAIIESERAMRLMCDTESKINLLKIEVELEISNN